MALKNIESHIERKIREIQKLKFYMNKLLENGFYSVNNEAQHLQRMETAIKNAKFKKTHSKTDINRMEKELRLARQLWELRRQKGQELMEEIEQLLKDNKKKEG